MRMRDWSSDVCSSELAGIANIDTGKGVFAALPAEEKRTYVASLTAVKENMSGALIDAAFSTFDIASYSENLDGLRLAWADRKAMQDDAAGYGIAAQVAWLQEAFETSFAPLSKIVDRKRVV